MAELDHRRRLEELFAAQERALFNMAYRYVWNAEDARDVVQDAFVRLWRKRDSVDWPRAAGLVYRIVLGLASNRRRGNRLRQWFGGDEVDVVDPRGGADVALSDLILDASVRRAIDELPERLRSVLVMCTFTELDYAAIGAILEIPAGTVGSRRTEAVARLRVAMEER